MTANVHSMGAERESHAGVSLLVLMHPLGRFLPRAAPGTAFFCSSMDTDSPFLFKVICIFVFLAAFEVADGRLH